MVTSVALRYSQKYLSVEFKVLLVAFQYYQFITCKHTYTTNYELMTHTSCFKLIPFFLDAMHSKSFDVVAFISTIYFKNKHCSHLLFLFSTWMYDVFNNKCPTCYKSLSYSTLILYPISIALSTCFFSLVYCTCCWP